LLCIKRHEGKIKQKRNNIPYDIIVSKEEGFSMGENTQILQGKRVVVVDDSSEQRKLIAELYRSFGCTVVGEANDGVEALLQVEKEQPEIVSLDIIMPNMDGVECYRKLQKDHPQVKVLFISCLIKNSEVRDILTNKLDPSILVPKPCEKEVLRKAVLGLYGEASSHTPEISAVL
jgi:two-component system chemotaxis response regulator CheY